jgi:hypothetical protein
MAECRPKGVQDGLHALPRTLILRSATSRAEPLCEPVQKEPDIGHDTDGL